MGARPFAGAGLVLAASLPALLVACRPAESPSPDYRVWAADQSGNVVHVLDPDGRQVQAVDLAASVGADRPHTLYLGRDRQLLFFANTVSNQAAVHRAEDGALLSVVEGVGKAPHAVQPHPDDARRAYVSNIAPRAADAEGRPDAGETLLELVRGPEDGWRAARRLDLTAEEALADSGRFPSWRPVVVGFGADGRHALVTLFDGGVAALDLEEWRVVDAWGNDRVHRHATLAVASPDRREVYVTGGSAEEAWLYVFDTSGRPELVAAHDLSAWGRDAHGAAVDPGRRELWVTHRASGTVTVHGLSDLRSDGTPVAVLDLEGETPDLIEISPDGLRAYVTLRGPNPAPTIPFPLAGRTPGVAVIDVPGRSLLEVIPLGDPEASDFHGVAVVPSREG